MPCFCSVLLGVSEHQAGKGSGWRCSAGIVFAPDLFYSGVHPFPSIIGLRLKPRKAGL